MDSGNKIKFKIPKELNEGQAEAFSTLFSYLEDPADRSIYVLKGWAGTGKTYTISQLIKEYQKKSGNKHKFIAVTGPTNKSVRVIKSSTGIYNKFINYCTIHKLLGLTERITADGKQEFVPDNFLGSKIESINALFIDEVSMLNDDLFHEVIKHRHRIKIICMGDPCQIPPVGKPDCIPFLEELYEQYGINVVELKEVMRQKGDNPIIEKSVIIRNNIQSRFLPIPTKTSVNERGDGVIFLNLEDSEGRSKFSTKLEEFLNSDEFDTDPDFVKILAWRNKTVDLMNGICRKKIYGEVAMNSKILIGERMLANTPVFMRDTLILTTNEEFIIEGFSVKTDNFKIQVAESPAPPLEASLKYYMTNISYLEDTGEKFRTVIHVLHEESQDEYKKILNLLKLKAIEKKGKDKTWVKYYNFVRRYADVNYSYSISCHKSQGSTYKNVFVLDDDIEANYNIEERNRIKYTAYTRASEKLYILKRITDI